jgi:hypothetical protein
MLLKGLKFYRMVTNMKYLSMVGIIWNKVLPLFRALSQNTIDGKLSRDEIIRLVDVMLEGKDAIYFWNKPDAK